MSSAVTAQRLVDNTNKWKGSCQTTDEHATCRGHIQEASIRVLSNKGAIKEDFLERGMANYLRLKRALRGESQKKL